MSAVEIIPNVQEPVPEKRRITKDAQGYVWGTGRRKSSVARVRLRPGTGSFLVNGRAVNDYFPGDIWRATAQAPLKVLEKQKEVDVLVRVQGGGLTGQAGAVSLGLARALRDLDEEHYEVLRSHGLMTRDARITERKKYGLRGARRAYQFSKR